MIVNFHNFSVSQSRSDGTLDMKQIESMSKQCALIAAGVMFDVAYYSGNPPMIDYIKDVEREIEKL